MCAMFVANTKWSLKREERMSLTVALLTSMLSLNLPSVWRPGVRDVPAPGGPGAAEEGSGDD